MSGYGLGAAALCCRIVYNLGVEVDSSEKMICKASPTLELQ